MLTKTLYTAQAVVTGGRDGRGVVDGVLDLEMSQPTEIGGAGGKGANPEQLFAVAYAACFIGSIKLVAGHKRVPFPTDAKIESAVSIGTQSAGGLGLAVELKIYLPGINEDTANGLVSAADKVCPFSDAVRGNVVVTFTLV